MNYPIHEMFWTIQGEGSAMGLPAFFVRTFGCPVKCTFCDAAGTWHPDWIPKDIPRLTPEFIAAAARAEGAQIAVITGGEPAIFDLDPLVVALQKSEIEVHLETSGAFIIQGDPDWIVLSPKKAKPPIRDAVDKADEFKVIVEDSEDIAFFTDMLNKAGRSPTQDARPVWLHPEWSKRHDPLILGAIVNAVKGSRNVLYRAGYQLHKLYSADAMDHRSRTLAPLGGDLSKGY